MADVVVSKPRRPLATYAMAAAASILIIVVTGVGLIQTGVVGSPHAQAVELVSKTGEIRAIALDDGSRVTLDTHTILWVAYTAEVRHLTLAQGRARFDVAYDASRPFVVFAGASSVIARGTLFDVALRDRGVDVALLRGSIEVRQSGARPVANRPEVRRILRAGESVSVSKTEAMQKPRALTASETRWTSGMLSFDDVTLAEAVAAANRYADRQIVIHDEATRMLRFTGTFKATDTANFARLLAASFGLLLSQDANGNFILSPSTDAPHTLQE